MGRKGISVPSEFSTEIIDAVQRAIDNSGMSNAEVIRKANISQDYYYTRTRYEKPFNTNDISRIAAVIGIDPYEIINEALSRSETLEEQRERIVLQKMHDGLSLAADEDSNKQAEMEYYPDAGA